MNEETKQEVMEALIFITIGAIIGLILLIPFWFILT